MSQQPPEWWTRQRGSRIGCADVTIVSIASITAFVILIFVLFRPDFAKVVDITNRNGESTVSAVRPTDTPSLTTGSIGNNNGNAAGGAAGGAVAISIATPTVPPTPTAPVPTATPQPTTSYHTSVTRDECRLRQDTSYQATIIQVFKAGQSFRIFNEQRYDDLDKVTWYKVQPDDGTGRQGWMVSTCF